jgi:putative ABC transport system permease protein
VYIPLAQLTDRLNAFENQAHPLKWAIRTTAAPLRLSDAIAHELRASGDNLVIGNVRTMDEVVARSTAQSDFNALVITLFAWLSVSLAALGLYGVMSYTIAQRTREIAVRMALGASAWRARRMIFEEAFRLTGAGVVIGAVASLALARYMDSAIFGIAAWDPTVLGGVSALLIGVALITTLLSARRVTTVRAMDALKHI